MELLSIEDLVVHAFGASRVVMANETHSGLLRCRRTREVGARIVHAATELGVRRLAMEALRPDWAAEANETRVVPAAPGGYLAQDDMRALVGAALDDGWTLLAYEIELESLSGVDTMSREFTNHRERVQAANLAAHAEDPSPLLVWCGNGHHSKGGAGDWVPMGVVFRELTGIDAFGIDQSMCVRWPGAGRRPALEVSPRLATALADFGGTAATLDLVRWGELFDALVVSVDNDFE